MTHTEALLHLQEVINAIDTGEYVSNADIAQSYKALITLHVEHEAKPDEPKRMVWKYGCKHGLPNFVHCPECDG